MIDTFIFTSNSEEETRNFAKDFASKVDKNAIIVLTGELRFW